MFTLLLATALAAQPTKRPSDEERGEELYRRHCVACHGVRNGGKGPATQALVQPVPMLQGKCQPNDVHIRSVLKGKAAMPGYEATFDRADAVRVLKYMNSLGPDKQLPAVPTKKGVTPAKKKGPVKVPPKRKGPAAKPVPVKPKAPAK